MKVYQHNVEAYNKVKIAFKASKRTCVVQPTGTGKSYVALQLINDNKDKKILYITSYGTNLRQFAELVNREVGLCKVDFRLYASSNAVQSIYDIVILDEFHRVGAKQWGKYVDSILEKNRNAYVLGLSATPIRYLDDKRDMSVEIFYGSIASEMTLEEAIALGIVRQPKYITCLYSLEKEYNNALKIVANMKSKEEIEMANELLKKARAYLENSKGLEEVFKESIDNKSGRYIVFCRDLEHLEKMYNESDDWFRGVNSSIHKYRIARDMTKSAIINMMSAFEGDNTKALKLLFSINMLNEGYHLESIDGVILLRATTSPNVYIQQIGRAISANTNSTPLIIDVVNNVSCLRLAEDLENGVNRVLSASSGNKEFKKKFSIIAFEKEFSDILDRIKGIRNVQCKDHMGNEFNSVEDMCKHWGINRNTYTGRIKLGWSKKDALETPMKELSIESCTDHLGNKFNSIEDMCKYWGITRATGVTRATYDSRIRMGWSKKDALEKPPKELDIESCTDHLGNKFNSIADMCRYWGVNRGTYTHRIAMGWSKKDALETPLKELDIEQCTDHLGNRFNSITAMCKHWGISKDTYNHRIEIGWSKKDALETPLMRKKDIESSTDHLGNKFNNVSDMCKYWGIRKATYDSRLKSGWSKKDALETQTEKFCTDHLGNKFNNIEDMCKHWGIARTTYDNRIRLGWNKKDALETPTEKFYTDHLGNKFNTIADMLKYWGISRSTYDYRIKIGLSKKDALETSQIQRGKQCNDPLGNKTDSVQNGRQCMDHLGNWFNSITAMCKHWGISKSTYDFRIKLGWSQKDALETPVRELNIESCTDHLGNKFNSIVDMCKHWGIVKTTYDTRIKLGWSKKDALETPTEKFYTDHLGNKFNSISDMCKHWGISKPTYDFRIKLGWSQKDALATQPTKSDIESCTDHLGNRFNNILAMCKYWGISRYTYDSRIKSGWSKKDALETPTIRKQCIESCTDHLGNRFNSITDMCKHWGINKSAYDGRIKLGWSKKDALETPLKELNTESCTDHLGNRFNTIADMLKHWGISKSTYDSRIKSGWNKKDALTIPPGYKK